MLRDEMTAPVQTIDLLCPQCGYDLRAIDSQRCPECGWEIDRSQMARSQLPWTYRREVGRWRAYWRTVWLATAHIKKLSMEIVRPVDLPDARRFATISGLIAGMPFALAMLGLMVAMGGTRFLIPHPVDPSLYLGGNIRSADWIVPYAAGITRWPVLPFGLLLAGCLLARSASLWFSVPLPRNEAEDDEVHRVRRARAFALSHYATASMAFLPLALALGVAGFVLTRSNPDPASLPWLAMWAALLGSWFIAGLCIALLYLAPLHLLSRTMRASGVRLLATAIGLPITWSICVGIGLLIWPWVAGFMWLMVDSLRP